MVLKDHALSKLHCVVQIHVFDDKNNAPSHPSLYMYAHDSQSRVPHLSSFSFNGN